MTDRQRLTTDELDELLPFYASGKISAADRARVEASLATDPALSHRLAVVREEQDNVIAENEAIAFRANRALDKIMAGIEAMPRQPALTTRMKQGFFERIGAMLTSLEPRKLAYAACGALALMLVQAVVLGGLLGGSNGSYETASAPGEAGQHSYIMASFNPDARAADLAALLKSVNASIADGPRPGGLFKLRIGSGVQSKDELARVLAILQANKALITMAGEVR